MLTVKALRSRYPDGDKWESDGAVRGGGALWVRIGASAVAFYFRYSHEGNKKALPLGGYDETGAKGLTLLQAREKAGELSKLYRGGETDLHGHLTREREEVLRARKDKEEAVKRAKEAAQRSTLKQLIDAYVGHLERQGKQSAKDVRSILDKHVIEGVPELAGRKAADLSVDDFVELIGKLVEANKGRTADKLRSYLRAAYQLAIKSRTDPEAPMALRAYGISVNPIASIGAMSRFNKPRTRVLNAEELAAFLRRVDALSDGAQKDALQLLLLLGGQRPMQMLRMKRSDVDLSALTVTLYDGKGARNQPRQHMLPLVKEAAAILERLLEKAGSDVPLFSTDKRTAMRHETISALVADISKKMVMAKEARESFQLRDLRRTAETMLASLKVSSDVRAQLLSHGLGGIQQRHYNFHDFAMEKRAALQKWSRHLAGLKAGKKAEVVPLKRRGGAAGDDGAPR